MAVFHTVSDAPTQTARYETGKTTQKRSSARRLFFLTAYPAYLVLLCFGGLLLYDHAFYWWHVVLGGRGTDAWTYYYPELSETGVLDATITPNDKSFDVLLLGGSVLEQVAKLFEQELAKSTTRPVRVFNLARAAHTTRDSMLKYDQLREKSFDMVVIYHGINDVRMNCCPKGKYRDDYTHCGWYLAMNRQIEHGKLTLPQEQMKDFVGTISRGIPNTHDLDYGDLIKTPSAFHDNLDAIVSTSLAKHEQVVLMTFSYFLPDGYSESRFRAHLLSYAECEHQLPAEIWGKPENLVATIDAHNEQIRRIYREHPTVTFVDQNTFMPKDGTLFGDPCHLSEAGKKLFVQHLIESISNSIPGRKQAEPIHAESDLERSRSGRE